MVTLSHKELQRIRVIEKVADQRLSVSEAAGLLGCSPRQVQRLKRNYQPDSVDWIKHRNRGRAMPWRLDPAVRERVLELARGKYAGLNDSHLHQKLVECEGLSLSRESVRRILRGAKLRSPQKRRLRKYRARRLRRTRRGTMLLTDASRHDWLEERGPRLTLIGFQDDATSEILAAHFQREPENAVGYLRCLQQLVTTHGIPFSVYRDRHGIFQRNDLHWTLEEELLGQQFPTQVGRAFTELGVQQIAAHSPQAKGRIERLWRTLQDRLLAELRLAGARSLDDANRVLAAFCADHNRRYAVPALESGSDFRPSPGVLIWLVVFAFAILAGSPRTTPSAIAATSSPCRHSRSHAVMPVLPSNSPINSMASCGSIVTTSCWSSSRVRSPNLRNQLDHHSGTAPNPLCRCAIIPRAQVAPPPPLPENLIPATFSRCC
jgi:transposase